MRDTLGDGNKPHEDPSWGNQSYRKLGVCGRKLEGNYSIFLVLLAIVLINIRNKNALLIETNLSYIFHLLIVIRIMMDYL